MARKLPWLTGPRAADGPRQKKRKVQEKEDDENDEAPSPASTPRRKPIIPNTKDHSSPPPPAPPQQALMIEGLDADDKYAMVEDEFEAVAKSFTRHLHHAEYNRLKELAREQNAQNINTIMRPIDVRTKVREPTKKMMQQTKNSKSQKAAIEEMMQHRRTAKTEDSLSEVESDIEDDPSVGTSLYGLMASARPSQQSLSSLADIKSNTRAAAGYSPTSRMSNSQSWPPRSSQPSVTRNPAQRQRADDPGGATTEEEDDDDLDGPVVRHAVKTEALRPRISSPNDSKYTKSYTRRQTVGTAPISPPRSSFPKSHKSDSSPSLINTSPFSAFRDPKKTASLVKEVALDDYPVPTQLGQGSSSSFKKHLANSQRKSRAENSKRREPASLNEVPTFLL